MINSNKTVEVNLNALKIYYRELKNILNKTNEIPIINDLLSEKNYINDNPEIKGALYYMELLISKEILKSGLDDNDITISISVSKIRDLYSNIKFFNETAINIYSKKFNEGAIDFFKTFFNNISIENEIEDKPENNYVINKIDNKEENKSDLKKIISLLENMNNYLKLIFHNVQK